MAILAQECRRKSCHRVSDTIIQITDAATSPGHEAWVYRHVFNALFLNIDPNYKSVIVVEQRNPVDLKGEWCALSSFFMVGKMQNYKEAILENIPYLRRYARSLTGNARLADRIVQQCIDCAVDLRQLTKKDQGNVPEQKVWLFSIFHGIFSEFIAEQRAIMAQLSATGLMDRDEITVNDNSDKYHRAFMQLPLQQKQIFLLVSVEKFLYEDVSKIVGLPLGAMLSLLHTARIAIAESVYIDDEKQATDAAVSESRIPMKVMTNKDAATEMLL